MINDDALFRAQIESLDKTLDEEFGSVFDEDVPAGAAPAIKQPLESFAAAAAVKLGTRFEAEDNEVERLKKKHVRAIGSTTTQIFRTIPQQVETRIESLPSFHKKKSTSLSLDATIQDYLSRNKRLRRRTKRSQHTIPRTSQRYTLFHFFCFRFWSKD